MTHARSLAGFVCGASREDLSPEVVEALGIRILDSLACALGALGSEPVRLLRDHLAEMGGRPLCTSIGGEKTTPPGAAFYNGALVRYLDFNDSFHAPSETCHPSDNLAPVLAAAEHAGASASDFLVGLAVAYQVHCRLSQVAPVRDRGFDHVTHGAFSATAGACRALGMDADSTAHALAIAGTANNALRVARTGELSHWKGLAFPHVAGAALRAALLARRGITGPPEVFEGNKGWRETVSGDWELDWSREGLDAVPGTDLKRYNAETHSQSAIEGLLELLDQEEVDAGEIREIRVEIFRTAYRIIGGGEEGSKKDVTTKEQADHSLPYLLAVAALDREVLPRQYEPDRIVRDDVQDLLRRVEVEPSEEMTDRFPDEHPCRVSVTTVDGEVHTVEKSSYRGFHDEPPAWEPTREKLFELGSGAADQETLRELCRRVRGLGDEGDLPGLLDLLASAETPGGGGGPGG